MNCQTTKTYISYELASLLGLSQDTQYTIAKIIETMGQFMKDNKLFGHSAYCDINFKVEHRKLLGIPDEDVLEFAIADKRAVLTRNWDDFRRLH